MHKSTEKKLNRQQKCQETLNRFLNDDTYVLHHISYLAGSVPKDSGGIVTEYSGRFGTGYTVDMPYGGNSGKYHPRYYFILKNENGDKNA